MCDGYEIWHRMYKGVFLGGGRRRLVVKIWVKQEVGWFLHGHVGLILRSADGIYFISNYH